jgi:hypothetical protein
MRPGGKTLSSDEVAWKTAGDTNTLAGYFPRSKVYRVGFARDRVQQALADAGGTARSDLINVLLAYSSNRRRQYVDGASPLLVDGRYSDTAPCGPLDPAATCRNGVVQIRAVDGMHLCPTAKAAVEGRLPTCPVVAPGALRLAAIIAAEIRR